MCGLWHNDRRGEAGNREPLDGVDIGNQDIVAAYQEAVPKSLPLPSLLKDTPGLEPQEGSEPSEEASRVTDDGDCLVLDLLAPHETDTIREQAREQHEDDE